jgi:DNA processing protein
MAKFSIDLVIKVLQLPRIGRKTAFKLFESQTIEVIDEYDFIAFVDSNAERFKLPKYSEADFEKAKFNFERIITQNEKFGIKTISFYDDDYPKVLHNFNDKPLVLSYIGNISLINKMPSVGIIGTRDPSDTGAKAARRFGEIFGEKGFNVVSGLAIGCDAEGHIGCLDKHGVTTAVLAHGLEQIYPKENRTLAKRIIDNNGILISEYFVGTAPQSNYFVDRDRIQAGLSNGVIVVETDIKGGTMHTVKFALENNRKVAAFYTEKSSFVEHPKSKGNQKLINEGSAKPLILQEDINQFAELINGKEPKENFNIVVKKKGKIKKSSQEKRQLNLDLEF